MTALTAPRMFGLPLGVRHLDLSDPAIGLSICIFRMQEDAIHNRLVLQHDRLKMFKSWANVARLRKQLNWGCA